MSIPRPLATLLRRLLPDADADVVIGDLSEEAARRAPLRRQAWLARQAIGLFVWSFRDRLTARRAPDVAFDLRATIRGLIRRPGFALALIVTVAVGIAGTTTMLALVHGILLAPLEYPQPERLVVPWDRIWASKSLFRDVEERLQSVTGLAAWSGGARVLGNDDGDPELVLAPEVSPGFLDTLGYVPAHGRFLRPADAEPGAAPVAVLGHELFMSRFGGDTDIVGDAIRLDGVSTTVVGVLPPAARLLQQDAGLVTPLRIDPSIREYRTATYLKLVGRLRDGFQIEQAKAEVALIAEELRDEYGFSPEQVSAANVVSLREFIVGDRRPLLALLTGAVVVLLLAACINAGSLTLARQMSRRSEIAVRTALGSGRLRGLIFLGVESVALTAAGGAAGTMLAAWILSWARAARPLGLPRLAEVHLSPSVLAISFAVTATTAVVAGLLPAIRLSRVSPAEALRAGRMASTGRATRRAREALVVAEVAIAVMLAIGAGLMGRSLWEVMHIDPGFSADGRLVLHVMPPASGVETEFDIAAYYERIVGAVDELPSTLAAAAINAAPVRDQGWVMGTAIEGATYEGPAQMPLTYWRAVTPAYFEAIGATIERGRALSTVDTAGSAAVAVVNRSFARYHWPGENPVGKRFRIGWDTDAWLTVAGVVRDMRHLGVDVESPPTAYRPLAQAAPALAGVGVTTQALVVHTAGDPLGALADIRAAIRRVDPEAAVLNPSRLDAIVRSSLAEPRLLLNVLASFGGAALFLSVVGIFGIVAQLVRDRRHELGVRQALGARPRQVVLQALRRGIGLGGAGLLLGTLGALALGSLLDRFLLGLAPNDPLTLGAVIGALGGCIALASWLPSRRAARVDPAEVLRV